MRNLRPSWRALVLLWAMAISSALAADASPDDPGQSASLFRDGQYELSLNTGVLFSPFLATGGRPTINYTITEVQLGYMLSEVHGESWHRGNLELVGEVFGSAIFKGSGNYIAGATLWLRYNFVPEKCLVVPYVQGGAGLTTTDIDPGIVGQAFNFNLEIGAGTRVLLNRNWALNLECRFQHVSNANTGRHNLGINSIGPIAGVSYLF